MRKIDILLEKERHRQQVFRLNSYLKKATAIIESYKGEEPLTHYLKKTFSSDKKYGSRDRKNISALCYYYYRIGHAAKDLSIEERILLGIFLCEENPNEILAIHQPEWNEQIHLTIAEKITFSRISFSPADIFPYHDELSEEISHLLFSMSHLVQPMLFLRLRKKTRQLLLERLEKTGWPYTLVDENCIALPNGTKTEEVIKIDEEAIVQDYSSQQVFNYLKNGDVLETLKPFRKYYLEFRHTQVIKAWDCCAASGGKSILLYDVLQRSMKPTVSDIRLPILLNLHQRFKKANLRFYDYFIGDLERNILPEMADAPFPIIVCDAPCTGSGTWGRTPEQLYFFKKNQIAEYAARQKKIVSNAIPHLAPGGLFFYITCSVFRKENEEVAAFIEKQFSLLPVHRELLKGWDKKADSMFVAVFRKEK